MSLEKMIEKAKRLVRSGRVERISHDRFNVVGDHGTYTVFQGVDGRVTCNCLGFQSKGRCSHAAAVIYLTELFDKQNR
ncbi:SWIM zinc finger family protein [Candidatus Bathyarchaeota archaeon]|nr:SWIM zinc finger family protein [Candidatus Bathyarchaeota archaeon]